MKNKAGLTISRVTSNQRTDFIRVVITDEASHAARVEVQLELHELAIALTGMQVDGAPADWANLDKCGKYLESKMCEVRLPVALHRALQTFGDDPTMEEKNEFAKILHENEAGGFRNQGAIGTFQNAHKFHAEENEMVAEIRYVRWVDDPPPKDI